MGELATAACTYVPAVIYKAENEELFSSGTQTIRLVTVIDALPPPRVEISSTGEGFDFSTKIRGALKSLNRLREFRRWGDNWDAEGAPAPEKASIDAATKILGLLALQGIEPAVMLNADGKPMFLIESAGVESEIVFHSSEELGYFVNSSPPVGGEAAFNGKDMPAGILALFRGVSA